MKARPIRKPFLFLTASDVAALLDVCVARVNQLARPSREFPTAIGFFCGNRRLFELVDVPLLRARRRKVGRPKRLTKT